MPTPQVTGGECAQFQGNSISGDATPSGIFWGGPPGGTSDQIKAALVPGGVPVARPNRASASGVKGVASGRRGTIVPTVPGYKTIITTHHGHSGANAQQILADLPTSLFLQVPLGAKLLLFLEDGINDAFNILNGSETIGDFINFHHQIYTTVLARWPTAIIVDVSCLCLGEVHTGNAWGANPADAQILQVDNAKAAEAALFPSNAVYVDFRAPLLTWEIANNPAQDPGGHAVFLEGNNVHPIAATGMMVMAGAVMATVPVVP